MDILEQMKMQDEKLSKIITDCLELQIACMLLQDEAVTLIKNDYVEEGLIMMAALNAMRESYNEQQKECYEALGDDHMRTTYQKIGGDKIIYSSISDEVIRCNALYFEIAPRPAGPEYAYNMVLSNKKRQEALHSFFPNLQAA